MCIAMRTCTCRSLFIGEEVLDWKPSSSKVLLHMWSVSVAVPCLSPCKGGFSIFEYKYRDGASSSRHESLAYFQTSQAHTSFLLELEPAKGCLTNDAFGGASAASERPTFMQFCNNLDEAAFKSMRGSIPHAASNDDSILHRCRCLHETMHARCPSWSDFQVCLACQAIVMYRVRMVDMFIRELPFLLWILEVTSTCGLTVGFCFMYHEQGCY